MSGMPDIKISTLPDLLGVKIKSAAASRKKMGKKIRMLRTAQKITQAQLGFESGLSRQGVSLLESGQTNVTFDTLYAIAETLDVPLKDLLDFN